MLSSTRDPFPAFAPNPSELPYAVTPKGWALAWLIAQYAFGLLLGAAVVSPLLLSHDPRDLQSRALIAVAGAAGAVFCARGLWRLRTPYAVFRTDSVERRGAFGWRRLARSDIAGVGKTINSRNGSYFLVYPREGPGGPLSFPAGLRDDPIVRRWLAGAVDPQEEAVKADRAAILADPTYGATESERAARLEIAKRAMIALALAGACGGAWLGFVGPLSGAMTGLALGVAGAGAAIVVASKGLIVWLPGARARPSAVGALGPLLGLMARAAFTVHLQDALQPIIGATAVGLAGAAVLGLRPVPALGGARAAIGAGILLGLAAFGAAVLADVAFDRSAPVTYATLVRDKHVHHGRSTTYTLDLAAVAGRPALPVSVGVDDYYRAQVGGLICVVTHSGALAASWFETRDCPAATPVPDTPGYEPPFYPPEAQSQSLEGSAVVECRLADAGRVADCRAISESPPGHGFGAAAVARIRALRANPATSARPVGSVFRIRVAFKIAK